MAEATIDPMLAQMSPTRADPGMILARSARRFGAKPALIAGGRTLTYRELHELCGPPRHFRRPLLAGYD